ncbi:MAG TPA: His/Gly/Thr/Pro-type tRNA ligase C-terminal domain-containing protein, partial [bacterium]|nr:His/Gly/Thr/Pro-type tRNA ligase C-terminal domain-containing protein [bacterium]
IFIVIDKTIKKQGFEIFCNLRNNGIDINCDYECKSFKSQFRLANKLKYRYVLILGEEEAKNENIKLKDFDCGCETIIKLSELTTKLKNL